MKGKLGRGSVILRSLTALVKACVYDEKIVQPSRIWNQGKKTESVKIYHSKYGIISILSYVLIHHFCPPSGRVLHLDPLEL